MEKEKYTLHFSNAVATVLKGTSQQCFNELPAELRFFIRPSGDEVHAEMDELDADVHRHLMRLKNKRFGREKILELLWRNGRVPKWVNMDVYETNGKFTVIRLFTSRRFREEKEIYRVHVGTWPFNPQVQFPPDPLRKEKGGKFDLNFKRELEFRLRPRTFWWKVRNAMKWYTL